jgi:hypothetical protein
MTRLTLSGAREALFRAQRPLAVPLVRIALCGWLAALRFPGDGQAFLRVARRPPGLLHAPVLEGLGLPWPPPPWVLEVFPPALVLLAALAALGIFTRLSLGLLFAVWLYVGAAIAGWGFFNHTPALAAQVVLALALLPGTTAYSVDRLALAWWRRRRAAIPEPLLDTLAPPAPRWGERLLFLAVGAVYFASGFAKLRFGAASWLDGTTLAWYLRGAREQLWFGPADIAVIPEALRFKDGFGIAGHTYLSAHTWAGFLADIPGVAMLMSWGTVILECGAPFLLLAGPRARGAFCVSAIVFHILVVAFIGPGFVLWMIIVGALIPWAELARWIAARRRRG